MALVVHMALNILLVAESYLGWALAGTLRQPPDRNLGGLVRVPPVTLPGNRTRHAIPPEGGELAVGGKEVSGHDE